MIIWWRVCWTGDRVYQESCSWILIIMCFICLCLVISRWFSWYCLMDHSRCSRRLIAAMVWWLSAWIRLMLRESSIFTLKVKTVLIHIFWEAFLTHIFLRHLNITKCFYYGVSFVGTRFKTPDCILKRFTPFLHPWYAHWFNQWWQNMIRIRDIQKLIIMRLYICPLWVSMATWSEFNFRLCYFENRTRLRGWYCVLLFNHIYLESN